MTKLINSIVNKDYTTAKHLVNEKLENIAERKKHEVKKMIAARKVVEQEQDFITRQAFPPIGSGRREKLKREITESLNEALDEAARIKIVRARIRGGVIQRRKKVSNVPGMTIRGGKLIRMSPAERRRRKMGQRRGKIKRRAKKSQMLRRRKMSLIKRSRLGI